MHHSTIGHCAQSSLLPHPITFEELLKEFKPAIERHAKKFAQNSAQKWEDDFIQEGSLALFDSMGKFILMPPLQDFRPYAIQAVKSRMIDFYRKNVKRSPDTQDLHVEKIETDWDGHGELISNFTSEPEFTVTPDFEIDYQIVFTENSMKAQGFSQNELIAFDLHVVQDYSVTEIAASMSVSVGQASKILAKVHSKSIELWKRYNNYEVIK